MATVHHRTPLNPANWPLLYTPTRTVITHHRDPERHATRWIWTGPAEVHTLHDLARLNAEATTCNTYTEIDPNWRTT